ncbi:MAG: hypothetical protein C4327_00215 [Meiothermus sp.]
MRRRAYISVSILLGLILILLMIVAFGQGGDRTRPTLALSNPPSGANVTVGNVTVSGEAKDDMGVTRLTYRLGANPEQEVKITPGTKVEFGFTVDLKPGHNVIILSAYDAAGNRASSTITVTYTAAAALPLPGAWPSPIGAPPTLLQAYWINHYVTATDSQVEVKYMEYRPRQFNAGVGLIRRAADQRFAESRLDDPGPYGGWDLLILPGGGTYTGSTGKNLLELYLNRTARIGLIWYGNPDDLPSWMQNQGWSRGADVKVDGKSYPVFLRTVGAGQQLFGGIERKSGRVYTVILAERDGKPSSPPPVPAGLEVPKPNAACPDWVHDQYMVKGFDGKMYRTWHPQIDPVYWCYFGHEHGSDPRMFAAFDKIAPAFGYVSQRAGADEPHTGFKLFAYDDNQGHSWLIQFHIGTGGKGRLCTRFHEYNVWVADRKTGELLADLHFMTDTGPALDASAVGTPDDPGKANTTRYKPEGCPDNLNIPMNNDQGRRRIPQIDRNGYETWQPSLPKSLGMFGARGYNTDNPQTRCSTETDAQGNPTCKEMIKTTSDYDWGENRWFIIAEADANKGFGINASTALATGVFYTDPKGLELRKPTDPDAVHQYLKPGLDIVHITGERWIPYEPWWVQYRAVPAGKVFFSSHNLEDSLRQPN